MKKKNLILIFSLVLVLNGCLNYTQITTIRTDDSGESYIHYWMKFYTKNDSSLISQLGIFNKDTLVNQFSASFTKINSLKVFKDFSDSTIHAQIKFKFSKFDSLNLLRPFKNSELSIKKGPNGTKIFSQFIPPFATGFGFDTKSIKIKYTYYLPGEIINNNATSKSNNKLVWDYSLDDIGKGKIISATYIPFRLKETPPIIYALALIVLLIVLLFLFKKKKV
ncbi:hypothetical protein BMS3Abin04_01242 [bacterium BMS3Abin04]|nr:hypothetical protein BMS3Abin04_01242 [bacterium BMS3Abin04]